MGAADLSPPIILTLIILSCRIGTEIWQNDEGQNNKSHFCLPAFLVRFTHPRPVSMHSVKAVSGFSHRERLEDRREYCYHARDIKGRDLTDATQVGVGR